MTLSNSFPKAAVVDRVVHAEGALTLAISRMIESKPRSAGYKSPLAFRNALEAHDHRVAQLKKLRAEMRKIYDDVK